MNKDSGIDYHPGGTTIYGPDGMKFFQAVQLAGALSLYAKTGMKPTRGVGITQMLALATTFTGKKYRRSEAMKASEDVRTWAQTMKAALPKTENGEPIP
jgi:hypothetical protein